MDNAAQAHLVGLLSRARVPLELNLRSDRKRQTFLGFQAAIAAFKVAGAIDKDEARIWTNRMLAVLGHEELEPWMHDIDLDDVIKFDTDSEVPLPLSLGQPPRLLRIEPVVGVDLPIEGGGSLQIFGVELYDRMVAFSWRMDPLPDLAVQFARELEEISVETEGLPDAERRLLHERYLRMLQHQSMNSFEMTDDLGTTYVRLGPTFGQSQFTPAVPSDARSLTIRFQDLEVKVKLA